MLRLLVVQPENFYLPIPQLTSTRKNRGRKFARGFKRITFTVPGHPDYLVLVTAQGLDSEPGLDSDPGLD